MPSNRFLAISTKKVGKLKSHRLLPNIFSCKGKRANGMKKKK